MSEAFDLADTIIPRSDQLNADDLMAGPRTITVVKVTRGNAEQPVNIITREFGDARPYKPSMSMRRVLVQAWGKDPSVYTGRRMMLFRDPTITFGKDAVGGIRISALSHIEQRMTLALTVSRGRRAPYTVDLLPDAPSKIPASFDAKLASMTAEQCAQARDYLTKYQESEPERVAALLDSVTQREQQLSEGDDQ